MEKKLLEFSKNYFKKFEIPLHLLVVLSRMAFVEMMFPYLKGMEHEKVTKNEYQVTVKAKAAQSLQQIEI